MADKMLIDATHPEETRVVVLRGNRVEEFDFESANRKQLRGNIYLAKVTRVEPSLQAAFVDYGGNRHRGAERPREVVRSEPLPGEEQPHVEALPGDAALGGLPPEQPQETDM